LALEALPKRASVTLAAAVLPVIFLGELPDKTMFASLVMATRGRPLAVWIGATAAFAVRVVIAITVGVLFKAHPSPPGRGSRGCPHILRGSRIRAL
jgi:putative Ca2+/H+ antiporter (TMEM165/GDT1 family)